MIKHTSLRATQSTKLSLSSSSEHRAVMSSIGKPPPSAGRCTFGQSVAAKRVFALLERFAHRRHMSKVRKVSLHENGGTSFDSCPAKVSGLLFSCTGTHPFCESPAGKTIVAGASLSTKFCSLQRTFRHLFEWPGSPLGYGGRVMDLGIFFLFHMPDTWEAKLPHLPL